MRARKSESGVSLGRWLAIVLATALLCVGLCWLAPSEVELDSDSYATTLALYRVCNQKSSEGLEQIEALIEPGEATSTSNDPGRAAIVSIIAQAKQDRWQEASKNCRQLLESQVQR